MTMKLLAAAFLTCSAATTPAFAASVDLSALGLVQGSLIAESDETTVFYDALADILSAEVDDGLSLAFFDVFPSDPTSAFLSIVSPVDFGGFVVTPSGFDIDATSAAGLFLDEGDPLNPDDDVYVLALLTLPAGTEFDFASAEFEISGATSELYAVAPIPLPAAAPLLFAGLGALAVAARRRKA